MITLTTYERETELPRYQRALERWLEREGIVRTNRLIDAMQEAGFSVERRMAVWLRDSLLWTIEEILANGARCEVYALRGLLQVAGYACKVGHDSTTHDAYIALRNILERTIEKNQTTAADVGLHA